MPIRLVACDLDGTLLNPDHQVSEAVARAVRRAGAGGLRVVLASGRNRRSMLPFLARLELDQPFIALGGGYAAHPRSSEPIGHWPLGAEATAQIAAVAREEGVTILHEEPDVMLIEGQDWAVDLLRGMSGVPVDQVEDVVGAADHPPTKIVLIGEDGHLGRVAERLARLEHRLDIAQSRANLLDITSHGVNKGAALRHLAAHLGLGMDEVAALGDGFNDLSMFAAAGVAIAVANAAPQVRQQADRVAPPNSEDGAAWALAELLTWDGRTARPDADAARGVGPDA